jgi:hypothetical protein
MVSFSNDTNRCGNNKGGGNDFAQEKFEDTKWVIHAALRRKS